MKRSGNHMGNGEKYLPEDGCIPSKAKYACKTCKLWAASFSGRKGHLAKYPTHEMYLVKHDGSEKTRPARMQPVNRPATNGHSVLDATARDMLLDYVLGKAKAELNAELDRMFRELKSAPTTAVRRGPYVAR